MTELLDQARFLPSPAEPSRRLRATDIRAGMATRWAAPEYAIMWEVADATGARHSRLADAVIMSLWPSRGLELHGVEIKVSRADWRREALTPEKAEKIAAYCDRWWVHTSPGVISDLSELPPAWGAREFDGKRWTTLREAALRPDVKPCDRDFLAALLRRADTQERESVHEAAQRMVEADRAAYEKRVADAVEQRTRRFGSAIKQVEAFEAAAGIEIEDFYGDGHSAAEIGALVKAIRETGILNGWDHLATIARTLKAKASDIEEVLRASGLPFPEAPEIKPKRRKGIA